MCPDGSSVGGEYVLSNHQCVLEFPCPPTPGDTCTQGSSCQPGSGCGSATQGGSGCATSCMCDGTSHFQCNTTCTPPDCSPGASCNPGTACTSSGANSNCGTTCKCDSNGVFDCSTDCQPPPIMNPCPGTVVPDICEICSNGTTECAHAILSKGQCAIEICPGS